MRQFQMFCKYYLIFLVIYKLTALFAKIDQVFSLKDKTLKNTGKWEKYWKSQGNLSVRKSQGNLSVRKSGNDADPTG